MIITQHGKKEPFFKLSAKVRGKKIVFFGWSEQHARRKLKEWLLTHHPVSRSRKVERKAPELRVINGGKRGSGIKAFSGGAA